MACRGSRPSMREQVLSLEAPMLLILTKLNLADVAAFAAVSTSTTHLFRNAVGGMPGHNIEVQAEMRSISSASSCSRSSCWSSSSTSSSSSSSSRSNSFDDLSLGKKQNTIASDVSGSLVPCNLACQVQLMDMVCGILSAATRIGELALHDLDRADGKSLLAVAATSGRPDVVHWLLSCADARDSHHLDQDGTSPLHHAACAGHDHVCELLIAAGLAPDLPDSTGLQPLHLAAEHGHRACCKVLLKAGANVNVSDKEGVTPLLLAVEQGQAEVCSLLIRHKANVLASSNQGKTPLSAAQDCRGGRVKQALEAALWPARRSRCSPSQGPEALEILQRTLRQR
mmetsp:Transcript_17525/g.37865  ORF Transcript_17525/g.37865 Transcript_17525/m.37865 type:complete len:341 (+) Transcript_17525:100-1122(+)